MAALSTSNIRIGTSGWYYLDWRDQFYPRGLPKAQWFTHYARTFATVEMNSTFYRVPKAEMFRIWAERAPAGFLFALKAPRDLTHRRDQEPGEVLQALLTGARELGRHLGPILYQFPPWLELNLHYLDGFLALLPAGFDHVLEFRHASWYEPDVQKRLSAAGVGFCIHDMKGSASPAWVTGPLAYVRFHGPTKVKYAGRYGTARLRQTAIRLMHIAQSAREVYVFFNNTMAGDAVTDALELRGLVTGADAALAAAPPA